MDNTVLATMTLAAMLVAGACTAATDKSGGETKPTTLVLANGTGQASGSLDRFVALVDERSEGRLRVEPSKNWDGKGEQQTLEDVAAGKAELGWAGTRAFDLIGVESFQPLHAPYLIGSYEAEQAVVGDDVTQDMLAGLDGSGLTGLALLGDELRYPAGADGPLLGPADFDGLAFGVWQSHVQSAGVTALGAQVTEVNGPDTDGLAGLETMWSTYLINGLQGVMPFVTTNAALWPRTTVIVANAGALDGLDSEDRDVLRQAATEAAEWSMEHADDDEADEIARACDTGTRIATASPGQLAALAKATRPVYAALQADPEQAALLARVESLVRSADRPEPIDVPQGCAYRPGDEDKQPRRELPAALAGPGRPGGLPAGTYRYYLTNEEIRQGVDLEPEFADANAGVWTWKMGQGRWSYRLKLDAQALPEGYAGTTCEGYYDVHGSQVDFTTVTEYDSGDCASKTWKAAWQGTEDGLRMSVTTDSPDMDFLFGAKTWERIE